MKRKLAELVESSKKLKEEIKGLLSDYMKKECSIDELEELDNKHIFDEDNNYNI